MNTVYEQYHNALTDYQKNKALRDVAVIELLFATGIRISELCAIQPQDIDLQNDVVKINGKGAKERLVHICDDQYTLASISFWFYIVAVEEYKLFNSY